jgi:hypothetical protein
MIGLSGCGDDADSARGPQSARATTSETSSETGARVVVSPDRARAEGVDAQDDPASPSALPRSDEVAGWIKTRPVRTALADELDVLIADADRISRLKPYRIKLVATCGYTHGDTTADVVMVQTHTAEDAFGVFSVEAPYAMHSAAGGAMRADEGQGQRRHAWKGRTYLRVDGDASDAGRELLSRILFALPDAERPPEAELFAAWDDVTPRRWVVRSAVSLVGLESTRSLTVPEHADDLLGLTPDSLLVVAAYATPASKSANTLWLVRYQSNAAARKAYQRYRKHIDQAVDAASAETMITEPKGRFLLGTWTAGAESVAHYLPRIHATLPG